MKDPSEVGLTPESGLGHNALTSIGSLEAAMVSRAKLDHASVTISDTFSARYVLTSVFLVEALILPGRTG